VLEAGHKALERTAHKLRNLFATFLRANLINVSGDREAA
jgi:hypothetical protein